VPAIVAHESCHYNQHYNTAQDKRQAIHDILNIQDARAFYEASGVRPKTVSDQQHR
jgi:hypothetical protein